mgnify:CR=1 FL=1
MWLSLSDTSVGNIGHYVGLKNFIKAWDDSIFQTAFKNTFFYTFWATIFKLALGMWLALLLNRTFKGKRIIRASMLLPFIIPTVLSTFAWRWMFDPTFSVLNWMLYQGGFIVTKVPFLSDGTYGMWCAIVVNTWRGMPFFAITLLGGPPDHQPRPPGSRVAGRCQWLVPLLARDLAAARSRSRWWWSSSRSSRPSPTSSSSTCSPAGDPPTPRTW